MGGRRVRERGEGDSMVRERQVNTTLSLNLSFLCENDGTSFLPPSLHPSLPSFLPPSLHMTVE